ncbi:MAG: protein kinase [Polyangiaceae bacterium]
MQNANAEEFQASRRRYRPLLELGRGGMSRVYLVESLASGVRKLVVLKILEGELAAHPEMREAFQREAELSARMNHPNVVQVFEVVEYSGRPVIVMEHLDGLSLSRVVAGAGEALPLRLHAAILCQMLAGLHHFHELRNFDGTSLHGVHRDVSPQNVIVLHDGLVKVVDFGIAKVNMASDHQTRAGMIKGKINYMPPEQLLGDANLDRRVDIFSAGVMLWEAIAKRRMWEGVVEPKLVQLLANGEIPKLRDAVSDVPEPLEHIVNRALSNDVSQRYASAEEMQLELEHAMAATDGHVHPRELSAFMQKHFGDQRKYQQRMIETALRNPVTSLSGLMECVTPDTERRTSGSRPIIEDPSASQNLPLLLDVSDYAAPVASGSASGVAPNSSRPKRRGYAWLLLLLLPLAGVALWLLRGKPDVSPSAPVPTVASPVTSPPVVEARPAAPTPREPVAEVTAPAASEAPVASDHKAAKSAPRLRHAPAKAAPVVEAPPLRSAAPAARAANCTPPFKLSPDGVRIFKPECF